MSENVAHYARVVGFESSPCEVRRLTHRLIDWAELDTRARTGPYNARGPCHMVSNMTFRRLTAALIALAVVACESGSITGSNEVSAVSIGSPRSEIRVGQSIQLSATPVNESGSIVSGATVTWETSDPAVATVEQSGKL